MMIDYNKGYAKCPVCGKQFYPAVEHAYKIPGPHGRPQRVCTYSCLRKWQKAKEERRKARKEK